MGKEWRVFVDAEGDPHLIIADGGVERIASKEECERAALILNEEGSNVIRLWCRNAQCKENGKGWIERSRTDVSKTIFGCDLCGKAMER